MIEVAERRMHILGGWSIGTWALAPARTRAFRWRRRRAAAPPVPTHPPVAEDDPLVNALDEAVRRARRRV